STGVFAGTSQSYAISPRPGYQVQDVLVDGGSVGAVASYTLSNLVASHTLSATFMVRSATHTITASSGPDGQVAPAGAVVAPSGSSPTFSIKPNAGSRVQDVLVDGISVGAVGTYTFAAVSSNHTIAASFVQDPLQFGT